MAYQTGTATGPADLLSQLETFIAANGWTVGAATTGKVYSNASNGLYCGVNSDTSTIWLLGATGYNSAAAWNAQPGAPVNTMQAQSNDMAGPYSAYHFFVTTDYIHVVVEVSAGKFKHLVIGILAKCGAFTGGQYYGAVYWYMTGSTITNYPESSSHLYLWDAAGLGMGGTGSAGYRQAVRADIDTKTNNWMQFNALTMSTNYAHGVLRGNGFIQGLWYSGPNSFNGLSPLHPIPVPVDRGSNQTSVLGYVKDMRIVNLQSLSPGQTVTIGSDQWLCFPVIQKTDVYNVSGSLIPSSGYYGYAYRMVP